jgi:upstream activation factor subunit UAF30
VNDDADADVDGDEIQVSIQPPKKKQRKSEDTEDADAKLAAMLQAQENQLGGGRATRGGSKSKSKPAKKKKATPRKKSANKVRPEDDSDLSGSEGSGVKTRKPGGGFQKLMNLSAPLAEVCGGESKVGVPSTPGRHFQKSGKTRLCDTNMPISFHDRKLSRSYGSISRRMSSKTPRTGDRSFAMTKCRPCSKWPELTCSR